VRPIGEVIRDITTSHFPLFWQEKVVWFWDDNLLVKRQWAKDLLREIAVLDKWWLTQASIDIVKDRELLDLMEKSGCIGIFLGIESLDEADLRSVDKRQNKAAEYRDAIAHLHERGICVMAGFISGFDSQTPDTILATADRLNAIGVDVPFLSILTRFVAPDCMSSISPVGAFSRSEIGRITTATTSHSGPRICPPPTCSWRIARCGSGPIAPGPCSTDGGRR
jgi:hypothetical protein